MKKPLICTAIGILSAGIIVLAGCASAPTAAQTAEFEKAAREIFAVKVASNLKEDADALVATWDKDFVKMANGTDPVTGLDVLRQSSIAGWKRFKYEEIKLEFDEFQLAGQFGWTLGSYAVTVRPGGGGDPLALNGSFLTVFKKQPDGSWKVYRDTMMSGPPAK